MTLVKTSILSFVATAIKLLAGLVINKAVAIYIGPSGLALIGQFQNFIQIAMTVASGAINTGVTKYTSEYGRENSKTPILFSTAGKISLTSSLLVGLTIILFSSIASEHLLRSRDYTYIFILFGITIPLFVINNILLYILNGLKEINTYIAINIIQSIYSLVFTTLLIIWLGLEGALIALVTNQSTVLIILLWMLRKHELIQLNNFKKTFCTKEAKKLMGYAAMALTSAATVPVSHLIIRNYIGETLGWEQAGYWQAIWYISSMYLMVVTTALSTYYLPKLSELKNKSELFSEIANGYIIIIPIVSIMAFIIYMIRDSIIWILFSNDFTEIRDLFLYQLIGDVVKIAAILIATVLLSKAMIKIYIITEILFSINFIILSIAFIDHFGLIGVTYSYLVNYTLYLIIIFIIIKSKWKTIQT